MHQIGNVPVNKIVDKLLSKSLQDAVCVLINSITNHLPSFEGMSLLQIQSSLEHLAERLQFVQSLYTRFHLLPKLLDITRVMKGYPIPEWEGSARNRTIYFVDKSRTRILVADPPSFMTIYDVVAIVVSQVLGAPAILPIGPLFACPDGSEKAVLRVLKLGSEICVINHEGRSKILVGKELLPQDALQVQFLPLRPFYTGEIVAWKTGRDGEKLRYGRVPEDARPSAGQALYRFPVETAPGQTQVLLSTQVFSFRSVSVADASSLSSLPGSSEGLPENKMLHGQASKDVGRGKAANEVRLHDCI